MGRITECPVQYASPNVELTNVQIIVGLSLMNEKIIFSNENIRKPEVLRNTSRVRSGQSLQNFMAISGEFACSGQIRT
jgi:hypothetical protein